MLWLCLYVPALSLEALTRLDKKAEQQAILIAEQHRVYYANQYAVQQGVCPGQSVATAKALCRQLHVMERDPEQERKALQRLALHSYQFTPTVSLQPPAAILLEISGSLTLFKGFNPLLEQLAQVITRLGHSGYLASGLTPLAAWLAAYANLPEEPSAKLEPSAQRQPSAKLEPSAQQEPSAKPRPPRQQLQALPLKYLDISDKQLGLLRDMGFTKLGELFSVPAHTLGKRLGRDFLHYLQQISGERHDPRTSIELPKQFNSDLFYIDGIENTQALLFPVKRLLSELCQYLRQRQLYCQRFDWRFVQAKQAQTLNIHLSKPQNHHPSFLELTRIKLEALKLTGAVHTIVLNSKHFSAATATTQSLLDNIATPSGQRTAPPEILLDRLHARLGGDSLFGIAPAQEHAPERAWQVVTDNQIRQLSEQQNSRTKTATTHYSRPSWLLNHPAPLQQRQQQLYWQGKKLTLLRGPERIDSDWWREQQIQRDYFVARYPNGQLYWIYRDIHSKRWFLHGLFA